MRQIKSSILLLLFLVVVVSCQTGAALFSDFTPLEKSMEVPLIVVLKDDIKNVRHKPYQEIISASEYAKFAVAQVKASSLNADGNLPSSARLLCIDDTFSLNETAINSVYAFVAKGGTLLMTRSILDDRMAFLMGLSPSYSLSTNKTAFGISFIENVLPNSAGLVKMDNARHFGFDLVNFSSNIKVLATAKNEPDYPVLLYNKVGKGKVLLFNSDIGFDKSLRGMVFSQMLMGLEGVPYPVANVANIHLDDFPSPVYKIYKEPIKTQMGLNTLDFVTNIWWPDMLALSEKHGIKYTAYTVFDYNTNVTPPFIFDEWEQHRITKEGYDQEISGWLGRDVINKGHELGFHGYNHVSLMKDEWDNPDYMVTALGAAVKKWQISKFGKLPEAYVPPSNYIDSTGLAKLHIGMPNLKYVQSTYLGDFNDGANREYGIEPLNSQFFDIPRISSGYFFPQKVRFNIASVFLLTGIWNHFVHPDDVFQIKDGANTSTAGNYDLRNMHNMPWRNYNGKKGLLSSFDEELQSFKDNYPMTRFLGATEAAEEIVKWRYAYYRHMVRDELYVVSSNDYEGEPITENYWFVYVSAKNDKTIENNLLEEVMFYHKIKFLDGYLYQIKTDNAFIALTNLNYENKQSENVEVEAVLAQRTKFQVTKFELLPFLLKLEKLENEGKMGQAIELIKNKLQEGLKLPISEWLTFAKLLSWENRFEEFWEQLNDQYEKETHKDLAQVALLAKGIYGIPNESIDAKWMKNAIEQNLGGLELLREFVQNYDMADNREAIKNAWRKIIQLTDSNEDRLDLLKSLLYNKDPDVASSLENLKPCEEDFAQIADDIAWYYVDQHDYNRAFEWSKCSKNIDKELKEYWFVKSVYFKDLKETDIKDYYTLLLQVNEKAAFKELSLEPICTTELLPLAGKIAELFGDLEEYRTAMTWSKCATNIDVTKLMVWHYELHKFVKVQEIYANYIAINPNDTKAKAQMARLYLYMGKLDKMAQLLSELEPNEPFKELRGLFNTTIRGENIRLKRKVFYEYNHLLSQKTKDEIKEELRLKMGNDVFFKASSMNDRFDPTFLEFLGGYSINDKKGVLHNIAAVQSFAYPINFIENEADNLKIDLIGLEYSYKRKLTERNMLSFSTRLERANSNKTYFHAGAAWQMTNENSFLSTELNFRSAQTGPAYVQNIYQTLFTAYFELASKSLINPIFTFEASNFSDDNRSATLNTRIEVNPIKSGKFKLVPLLEGAYSVATTDLRDGFPYWIADDRLIQGGGFAIRLGKSDGNFFLDSSATIFFENQNQPSFERYLTSLNFKMAKYFSISASAEFYTIESFFSNSFNVGLRYDMKLSK